MRRLITFFPLCGGLLLLVASLLALGCGGWYRNEPRRVSMGHARFTVAWHQGRANGVDAAKISNLNVLFKQGDAILASQWVTKPDQMAPFRDLAPGDYTVFVLARETMDASGPIVAAVGIPVTIRSSKMVDVHFSLTAPIDHIEIFPSVMTLDTFSTGQFLLTARDASGGVVLGSDGGLELTSSDPAVATVVVPGVVTTGAIGGRTTIRATDTVVGKSAEATLVVRNPPAVTVLPSRASVPPGRTLRFSSSTFQLASPAVTWSVREGAAGGTVAADGLYTAPSADGVYHVVATSVADPRRKGTATVTVAVGGAGVIVH